MKRRGKTLATAAVMLEPREAALWRNVERVPW
jgi:hypothetical protein